MKETRYRVFFIDDSGNKVSSECIYNADKKDNDASNRKFKLRFTFKNMKYDIHSKYYLVAYDEATNLEIMREEMVIDIIFADDFGF